MPRRRRPTHAEMERQCASWNDAYPIGTKVSVLRDNGELLFTRTRSTAQILSGHTAVIWVDGIVGCYLLDRVKLAPDAPEATLCPTPEGHRKEETDA